MTMLAPCTGIPGPPTDIDHAARPARYELLEAAVRELLCEKRVIAPDELRPPGAVASIAMPYRGSRERWEARCAVLAEALASRGVVSPREKRDCLGALDAQRMIRLSHHERTVVALTNAVLRKRLFTPTELAGKVLEVTRRRRVS